MKMKKTILFYADPGHGWAKVRRAELVDLGITEKISSCSYQKGEFVYLEEDCDLSVYMDALRARGITEIKFSGKTCATRQSRIRSFERYSTSSPKEKS